MRAIISVIRYAGYIMRSKKLIEKTVKISEQDKRKQKELKLIKTSLKDYNTPKIVAEDLSIFNDLLNDVFPVTEVSNKMFNVFNF